MNVTDRQMMEYLLQGNIVCNKEVPGVELKLREDGVFDDIEASDFTDIWINKECVYFKTGTTVKVEEIMKILSGSKIYPSMDATRDAVKKIIED